MAKSITFAWISIVFNLLAIILSIVSIGCIFADVLGSTFPGRLFFWNLGLTISAVITKCIGSYAYKNSLHKLD